MSVLQKLMLMFPHVEFESPELKSKFTDFVTQLDNDLDSSGFDTSSITDERLEALEECWSEIENDIVVEVSEASDEEQVILDGLADELDEEEADEDAEAVTPKAEDAEDDEETEDESVADSLDDKDDESNGSAIEVIEETEETEIVLELEEDEEFESELADEIAEQEQVAKLAEVEAKLKGESKDTPDDASGSA